MLRKQHEQTMANTQFVTTLHQPESVVDIYFDQENNQVIEEKGLTNNRYKRYRYSVDEFMKRYVGYKGVDIKLQACLNNA